MERAVQERGRQRGVARKAVGQLVEAESRRTGFAGPVVVHGRKRVRSESGESDDGGSPCAKRGRAVTPHFPSPTTPTTSNTSPPSMSVGFRSLSPPSSSSTTAPFSVPSTSFPLPTSPATASFPSSPAATCAWRPESDSDGINEDNSNHEGDDYVNGGNDSTSSESPRHEEGPEGTAFGMQNDVSEPGNSGNDLSGLSFDNLFEANDDVADKISRQPERTQQPTIIPTQIRLRDFNSAPRFSQIQNFTGGRSRLVQTFSAWEGLYTSPLYLRMRELGLLKSQTWVMKTGRQKIGQFLQISFDAMVKKAEDRGVPIPPPLDEVVSSARNFLTFCTPETIGLYHVSCSYNRPCLCNLEVLIISTIDTDHRYYSELPAGND